MTTPSYLDGVRGQPENLARSAATVRAALRGPVGEAVLDALGSGSLAVFGMGASTAAATAFAAALRGAGRASVAISAADLGDGMPSGLADGYLAVSQSGRSRETVEAMARVHGAARVALTNDPTSPLGAVADAVIPLGCGEDSRVSTLSYTATLQALGLLADSLAGRPSADWPALPDAVAAVLADDPEPIAAAFADVSCVDVVGAGLAAASAAAAGLLLREAAHLPTATYSTGEYLHGPLESAGPGRGALLFGAGRELRLAADLASYGAQVVLLTASANELPGPPNLRVVRRPALSGLAGCVVEILPIQLAASRLAERQGLPIELRHMPDDTKLDAGGRAVPS